MLTGMICPFCNSDTKVTNSRPNNTHPEVWRRRQCKSCESIWTTREYVDLSMSHRVRTRHKRLQAFSRDILLFSIKDSLSHRKSSQTDAPGLTDTVLERLIALNQPIIETQTIIEITQGVLYHFDQTASAVYTAK